MAKAFVVLALLAISIGSVAPQNAEIGEEENVGGEEMLELVEDDTPHVRRQWNGEEIGGEEIDEINWADQTEEPSSKRKQVVVTEWGSGWPNQKPWFRKSSKKTKGQLRKAPVIWESAPEVKGWDWMSEKREKRIKKEKKVKKDVSVTNWGFPAQNSWDWLNEAHSAKGGAKMEKEVTMWGFPPGTTWNWDWPDEPVSQKAIENIESDKSIGENDWSSQGKGWEGENENDNIRELENDDQGREPDVDWREEKTWGGWNEDNGQDEGDQLDDNDDRDQENIREENNGGWGNSRDNDYKKGARKIKKVKKIKTGWSWKNNPKVNEDLGFDDKLEEGLDFLRQKAADIETEPLGLVEEDSPWRPITPPRGWQPTRSKGEILATEPVTPWRPVDTPVGWKGKVIDDEDIVDDQLEFKAPAKWTPPEVDPPGWGEPAPVKGWSQPEEPIPWSQPEINIPETNEKENLGWGEAPKIKENLGWADIKENNGWRENPEVKENVRYIEGPEIIKETGGGWGENPEVQTEKENVKYIEGPEYIKETGGWGEDNPEVKENVRYIEGPEYIKETGGGWGETPEIKENVKYIEGPEYIKETGGGWGETPEVKENVKYIEGPEYIKETGGGWGENPEVKENVKYIEGPEYIKETGGGWGENPEVKENVKYIEGPEYIKEIGGGWGDNPEKENVRYIDGPEYTKETGGWGEKPEVKENVKYIEGPEYIKEIGGGWGESPSEGYQDPGPSWPKDDGPVGSQGNQEQLAGPGNGWSDENGSSGRNQGIQEQVSGPGDGWNDENENSGRNQEENSGSPGNGWRDENESSGRNQGIEEPVRGNGWRGESPEENSEQHSGLGNGWGNEKSSERNQEPQSGPGNGYQEEEGSRNAQQPGNGWEPKRVPVPVGWQNSSPPKAPTATPGWKPDVAEKVKNSPELISDVAWKKAVNQALGFKEVVTPAIRGVQQHFRRKQKLIKVSGHGWKQADDGQYEWKLLANGKWVKIRKGLVTKININGKWFRVSKEFVKKPGARRIKVIKTISSNLHSPPGASAPQQQNQQQPSTGARRVNVNTKPEGRVWGKSNGAFPKVNARVHKFITDLGWGPVKGGWQRVRAQKVIGEYGKVKEASGWITNQEQPKINSRWEKLVNRIVQRGIGPNRGTKHYHRGRHNEGLVFKKGIVWEAKVHNGGIQANVKLGLKSKNQF